LPSQPEHFFPQQSRATVLADGLIQKPSSGPACSHNAGGTASRADPTEFAPLRVLLFLDVPGGKTGMVTAAISAHGCVPKSWRHRLGSKTQKTCDSNHTHQQSTVNKSTVNIAAVTKVTNTGPNKKQVVLLSIPFLTKLNINSDDSKLEKLRGNASDNIILTKK
jgi:hypothetical protein